MTGGMVSSTLLTLLVIPAIYSLWKGRQIAWRIGFAAVSPKRPVIALLGFLVTLEKAERDLK